MPKLSIVTTLYMSSGHLEEFCQRANQVAEASTGGDYEIVLVNDGSPDDSLEIARRLCQEYPRLKIVNLSRNFGHYKAVMTGLAHARGELIYLLDSDLEEEPEWLPDFSAVLLEQGADVVYGVQADRKGGLFEKVSGDAYWRLYSTLTGFELPRNQVTARLMTRRYVDAVVAHKEKVMTMGVVFHLAGFRQVPMTVKKLCLSPSTYTFGRKLKAAVDSVLMVSSRPLAAVFVVGLSVLLLAFVASCYWLFLWITKQPPAGWVTLVISIWALGGMNICAVGIVGIYVSKVFEETKIRPYSVVSDVFGYEANEPNQTMSESGSIS